MPSKLTTYRIPIAHRRKNGPRRLPSFGMRDPLTCSTRNSIACLVLQVIRGQFALPPANEAGPARVSGLAWPKFPPGAHYRRAQLPALVVRQFQFVSGRPDSKPQPTIRTAPSRRMKWTSVPAGLAVACAPKTAVRIWPSNCRSPSESA